MNNEAEAEIERLLREWVAADGPLMVGGMLKQAMRWAYADATKVCHDLAAKKYVHAQGAHLEDVAAIEKRAK